jgi:uncharacterized membrane protein YozB (DUF420 family)
MDPRLQPGFLGTGASLMSDLSLLAYVLLIIPAILVGFVFARRKLFRPYHKWTMRGITVFNWVLILFLMQVKYREGVVPGIPQFIGQPAIFLPTIHLLFGAVAQILATYNIYRMYREDSQVKAAKARGEKGQALSKYYFTNAKTFMRVTLTLWLITALFGIITYFSFYTRRPGQAVTVTPAVTAEPGATAEPGSTPEPPAGQDATPEATAAAQPASTPNSTPETTPEVATTPETTPAVQALTPETTPAVTPNVTPEVTARP